MKTKSVSLILAAAFILCGCATTQLENTAISTGISAGIGLIPDASRRAMVANYADVAAATLRAATGNETTAELSALLNAAIPSSVRAKYPEIISLVTPVIISTYKWAYDKYGAKNNTKLYGVLNDLANDIEIGASAYVSHQATAADGP
jgi:hypothetical protein